MSLNNLPAGIATAIQQGFLEKEFHSPLVAALAFRSISTKEPFPGNIGESLTRTRAGLFPVVTTPMSPAANTDLNNGLTASYFATEQYSVSINQYGFTTDLNMATSKVAIADIFLQNARKLAEGAARSIETLARNQLYTAFMGLQSFVTTTLGSAGVTVAVDDIRGFATSWNTTNQPVATSSSNPLAVTFTRFDASGTTNLAGATSVNTTGGTYNCTGATADGSNTSTMAAFGGISGTLTFSANVAIADATAANGVMAAMAQPIIRANNRASSPKLVATDILTVDQILAATSTLEANGVKPLNNGFYRLIAHPFQLKGLYKDPAFRQFQQTNNRDEEYIKGVVGHVMGCEIVYSDMVPVVTVAAGQVHNALVVGDGAMVESEFTGNAYAGLDGDLVTMADGVAHITREPLDRLKQVVTQSWSYFGGFVCPTDITTSASTIPSAGNAAYKRGVVLQSLAA